VRDGVVNQLLVTEIDQYPDVLPCGDVRDLREIGLRNERAGRIAR
jgi:hypothetical protein